MLFVPPVSDEIITGKSFAQLAPVPPWRPGGTPLLCSRRVPLSARPIGMAIQETMCDAYSIFTGQSSGYAHGRDDVPFSFPDRCGVLLLPVCGTEYARRFQLLNNTKVMPRSDELAKYCKSFHQKSLAFPDLVRDYFTNKGSILKVGKLHLRLFYCLLFPSAYSFILQDSVPSSHKSIYFADLMHLLAPGIGEDP